MEVKVSQALGISSGSCHQDNCVFAPLLDSQASSSSGGDRHAPVNPAIGSSASWSSSLANSFPSGGTETDTDQLSGAGTHRPASTVLNKYHNSGRRRGLLGFKKADGICSFRTDARRLHRIPAQTGTGTQEYNQTKLQPVLLR
ncbi:Hypothetical protein SMAX5B_009720 [Scophthalmus maximus]|uniref:Uncharacterized protein n=1 Tax=Scophthalmus maximus TaxID=52904 RepID=A0A2U9BVL9_SCOMX|nr:Hypothetical protein SMAX5B_009720 [Scophthalmus maximus]